VPKESSFDVVSEIDLQEVRNAVDQAAREVAQRFDFKNTGSSVELNSTGSANTIVVRSNTEQKVKDCVKVLEEKLVRRKVPLKAVQAGDIQPAAGGTSRQTLTLTEGISQDKARAIVKLVKESKSKAQASVQGDQVRVSAKSKDVLQETMGRLKEHDFGIPLQFVNYR
jgi:cyclic-di-GMP-binding protein